MAVRPIPKGYHTVTPWGNQWYIHTHIENLTAKEISKRAAALQK